MRRWFVLLFGVAFLAGKVSAADQLPTADEEESFEIEPPLLIPYERPREPVAKEGEAVVAASIDIEKLTRDVERAKRSALNAERLFRMGALARVEAEQKALRVVRLQAELENAKLARIKEDGGKEEVIAEVKASVSPDAGAALNKPNDIDLAKAIEAAHAATKKREQAEIEAAEANLARQQKLLSLGSGRKADVARAAEKLEELKSGRN